MENKKIYEIWTDGSYRYHTKCGGWGSVIIDSDNNYNEYSGIIHFCRDSDEAEFLALLHSLETLPDDAYARIYSDCTTVIKSINRVYNAVYEEDCFGALDLYPDIIELLTHHIYRIRGLSISWVKAHSTDWRNNRADKLARAASKIQGKNNILKHIISNQEIKSKDTLSPKVKKANKKPISNYKRSLEKYVRSGGIKIQENCRYIDRQGNISGIIRRIPEDQIIASIFIFVDEDNRIAYTEDGFVLNYFEHLQDLISEVVE